MIIHQMSDLHLEFNPDFRAENREGADVLILGGDICVADYFNRSEASPYYKKSRNFIEFFEHAATQYKWVLYILGNHEHYDGRFPNTVATLRRELGHISKLIILDNSAMEIGGTLFLGTTLWTDCNKGSTPILDVLSRGMNDFRLINYSVEGFQRFTPATSIREHRKALEFLDKHSKSHSKIVVLTHHAPSYQSIHSNYRQPRYEPMNYGYYSNLEEFILARPQIKLWTHGHVHNNHNYQIGDTRIICSPHGYGKENANDFGIGTFIEIE
jgi:Icc-related predicted phosphoesterase